MNNNVLFLLHVPPPVHGSSVVGLSIKESATINSRFNCSYVNLLASQNIEESGTVNSKKLIGFAFTWLNVLKNLRRKRPDLCYFALTTTGPALFKDLMLVALLKAFRVKLIYHLHNRGVSKKSANLFFRALYSFIFKEARVILLSPLLYHDIQYYVDPKNIYICPNGIPDSSDPAYLQDIGDQKTTILKRNKVRLLFLSNLIETKGVVDLLKACRILKDRKIDFECIFVGGESDITAAKFRELVSELNLSDNVTYEGKKYDRDKALVYQNSDIFVFPTYYSNECFPLVLLEAMSYSLPVVSTYEGAINDIVEIDKTGLLVKQRNVEELADKISLLIADENLRHQMGQAGRKKYEEQFTLSQFETRLAEILANVLTRN